MSIKLEVTFGSFEELAGFTALMSAGISRSSEKDVPKASVEKAATPVKEIEVQETSALKTAAEVPANPKFDDVKAAILNLNKIKGKVAAVGVLNKFGAEKVGPQLKEADYGAVIAECNKVLSEA